MSSSNLNAVVYRLEGVLNDLEGRRRQGVEEGVAETKHLVDKIALISTNSSEGDLVSDPLLNLFDIVIAEKAGRLALGQALSDAVSGVGAKPSSTISYRN